MHRSPLLRFRGALLPLAFTIVAGAAGADFQSCLGELRREAQRKGVTAQTFDTAMAGVEFDQSVIDAMDYQPEFTLPVWDYLAGLVDAERIADGRARLTEWAEVLDAVERAYGVDRYTIVAVWGVESDYGRVRGGRPLVRSLTTASCSGRRQSFFRGELFATLQILQSGDMPREVLVGSWAGAFGQTQFMPTTFQRLAVDFDGDGRRDIVGSVPDALASTANYLKQAGWVSGAPWGHEVRIPADYSGPSGRRTRRSLNEWQRVGVRALDGSPVSGSGSAALLLPAGKEGPAFLVFRNFHAIYSYNLAVSYALAIAHLADRLRGSGPFVTPWPTDDPGLSRAERRELQELLAKNGHDIGTIDGVIGSRTRRAITDFQTAAGLEADGRASTTVLNALRDQATQKTIGQ